MAASPDHSYQGPIDLDDELLVVVKAKEVFADDCCVRIAAGTKGFLNSLWINRTAVRDNLTKKQQAA